MSDLVIDADIMRAAGVSEHPVSSNARLILESIKSAGHRMVHTPAIIKEHKKHQSRFAKTWRASMFSRKLHAPKNASEDAELRKHLVHAQNVESPNDETAVLKDAHLLEAAAASDMRVLSKDTTAKRLFQKGCPLPEPYGRIQWADVTLHPDQTLDWIAQGCPEIQDWRLCP